MSPLRRILRICFKKCAEAEESGLQTGEGTGVGQWHASRPGVALLRCQLNPSSGAFIRLQSSFDDVMLGFSALVSLSNATIRSLAMRSLNHETAPDPIR